MSSDQIARLAATIEVMKGAVTFLIAERAAARPASMQGDLLDALQQALATQAVPGRAGVAAIDPAPWMPVVAAEMMDAVRRQIGLDPEGVRPAGRVTDRAGLEPPRPANRSEVAERAGGEHARAAVAHFERGRAVA